MSTDKEQKIAEEARRYVDAARYFDDARNYVSSIQRLGMQQLLQATSEEERAEISARHKEHIGRSIGEAQRMISPPIIALNELTEDLDQPVYFEHHGRKLMVIPRDDRSHSAVKFEVRPKGGGPETAL